MSSLLLERLDDVDRRLRALQAEVAEIRAAALQVEEPAPVQPETPALPAEPEPVLQAEPVAPAPPFWPPPPSVERPPRQPRPPRPSVGEVLQRFDLLGARGLALAGGAVTLLGILFLYVLATNRGWIGPEERVLLGAIAAGLLFAGGLEARRRYGHMVAALAAVGIGVAGWYATLAAATVVYDLLPTAAALGCAAAIAGVGLAVALLWSSEILAGLALLGAALSPAFLALDHGVTPAGTAFAAVVFAALAVVAITRGWRILLVLGSIVVGAQALWTAADAADGDTAAAVVAAATATLIVAAALARQLVTERDRLDDLAGLLVAEATGLSLVCASAIYADDADRGLALLVMAGVAAVACALAVGRKAFDFAWTVGGMTLVLGTVATADLVSGATLASVWAVQATVAVLLVARTGIVRFLPVALGYLALAVGYALLVDAPLVPTLYPEFSAGAGPALGVALAGAAALLLAGLAFPTRAAEPSPGIGGVLDAAIEDRRRDWPYVRSFAGVFGSLLLLAALGLVLVDVLPGSGQQLTVVLFALTGAVAVALGSRRGFLPARLGGFVLLAVAYAKPIAWDWHELGARPGALELLVASAALLAGGYCARVLSRSRGPLDAAYLPCSLLALAGSLVAIGELVENDRLAGVAVLAVVAAYTALAAAVFRRQGCRDVATVLWAQGLVALLIAEALLIEGRGIAVAYAATAVALGVLAARLEERRLQVAALVVVAGTTAVVLGLFTSPDHLTEASVSPAESLWMLVACVAALFALAALAAGDLRTMLAAVGAALAVYALSLGILELAVRVSGASLATDFQRGHTAVSGMWAAIALVVLAVGLTRRSRALRLGGLALLGVALAKLFLYDLSALSSITRAFSFLAVGLALLVGGLLVQRLTDDDGGVDGAAPSA